ncbi:tRNA dihydrouridine synthase DusB [Hoeflea sp. YIM 152468]|uniref:tRNA dihydrouridine synthase DusB n=1 Tax=Hoeflea sp. YIM 152468 TaxID=3031759 RepID=UPI0023DB6B3A|nr:tRNA dihydrouridine synthase DusB [Hoeflea sp. YIM 152468]MDF1608933.1 tRNA dihydrouridine synthase DusB [Hoeflea sp. YIM 152468]
MQNIKASLSQPLQIGPVTARNRVFLAPLSGISDLPFRQLAWQHGAGLVFTEMVASRELVTDSRESLVRLRGDGIDPHVVQLAGREAGWMGEAARIAEAAGAAMIDINMGCPAKKVTGGYSGSALMRDPDHALELIAATVKAVSVPVTLKMRLGWDDDSHNAPLIAARAEAAGVQMITIHGRTRMQFYDGVANWDAIARVRDAVSVPLIANGDVTSPADIAECLRRSGADAVMVGRAARGQPWICGELAGSDEVPAGAAARQAVALAHYRMMISHYGEDVGVRHARKHIGWYLETLAPETPAAVKTALMTARRADEVFDMFAQALAASLQASVLESAA